LDEPKRFCGTSSYISPEMIQGLGYDFCTDWWSFGVIAYQLLCRKMPDSEENKKQMFWKIENVSPRFPISLDKTHQDFLHLFFAKNPKNEQHYFLHEIIHFGMA
jgi:serine/threonine protein kinase